LNYENKLRDKVCRDHARCKLTASSSIESAELECIFIKNRFDMMEQEGMPDEIKEYMPLIKETFKSIEDTSKEYQAKMKVLFVGLSELLDKIYVDCDLPLNDKSVLDSHYSLYDEPNRYHCRNDSSGHDLIFA
jgi:hypothetical protein